MENFLNLDLTSGKWYWGTYMETFERGFILYVFCVPEGRMIEGLPLVAGFYDKDGQAVPVQSAKLLGEGTREEVDQEAKAYGSWFTQKFINFNCYLEGEGILTEAGTKIDNGFYYSYKLF
jgi:hypothetical protein